MGFEDELRATQQRMIESRVAAQSAARRQRDVQTRLEREFEQVLQEYARPAARTLAGSAPTTSSIPFATTHDRKGRQKKERLNLHGWFIGCNLFLSDTGNLYGQGHLISPDTYNYRRWISEYKVPHGTTVFNPARLEVSQLSYQQYERGDIADPKLWVNPTVPEFCVKRYIDEMFHVDPLRSVLLQAVARLLHT